MKVTDQDMREILFLDRHAGWTWADMQAAPETIVEGLMLLDAKRAAHK